MVDRLVAWLSIPALFVIYYWWVVLGLGLWVSVIAWFLYQSNRRR